MDQLQVEFELVINMFAMIVEFLVHPKELTKEPVRKARKIRPDVHVPKGGIKFLQLFKDLVHKEFKVASSNIKWPEDLRKQVEGQFMKIAHDVIEVVLISLTFVFGSCSTLITGKEQKVGKQDWIENHLVVVMA